MKLLRTSKHRLLGTKAVCWDNPKPLKVSGIVLTSLRLGDQTRCLLVFVIADTESI